MVFLLLPNLALYKPEKAVVSRNKQKREKEDAYSSRTLSRLSLVAQSLEGAQHAQMNPAGRRGGSGSLHSLHFSGASGRAQRRLSGGYETSRSARARAGVSGPEARTDLREMFIGPRGVRAAAASLPLPSPPPLPHPPAAHATKLARFRGCSDDNYGRARSTSARENFGDGERERTKRERIIPLPVICALDAQKKGANTCRNAFGSATQFAPRCRNC